jgi:hypothetical protein
VSSSGTGDWGAGIDWGDLECRIEYYSSQVIHVKSLFQFLAYRKCSVTKAYKFDY